MSNPYILKHHGVLGMKWGVRRYQNKDGSLTEAGRKRLAKQEKRAAEKEEKTLQKKKKIVSNMDVEKFNKNIRLFSNEEIYAFKKRYEAEKEARHIGKNNTQERIDKIKKTVDNAGTLLSSYQKAASIVNNVSGQELLPEFNLAKKQEKAKKAKEKARNAYLQTLDPNDVLNNYKNFSTDDMAQLQKRFSNLGLIDKQKNLDAFKKVEKDNYKGYDTPIIETAPWGDKESPSAYFRSEIYDNIPGKWQTKNTKQLPYTEEKIKALPYTEFDFDTPKRSIGQFYDSEAVKKAIRKYYNKEAEASDIYNKYVSKKEVKRLTDKYYNNEVVIKRDENGGTLVSVIT